MVRLVPLLVLFSVGCPPSGDRTDPDETSVTDDTDTDADTDSDTDTDTDTDSDSDTDSDTEPEEAPMWFRPVGHLAGLTALHWDVPHPFPQVCDGTDDNGAGAAVGDYDGDGDLDIFFARYDEPSMLYRNRGDGSFDDVAEQAGIVTGGWPSSATWADVDGDGHLDLTLTFLHHGYLALYMNQGDGTFVEETDARGLDTPPGKTNDCPMLWGVAYGDYDLDGDLDLMTASWGIPIGREPIVYNQLYQNQGDGTFVDRTDQAGLAVDYDLMTYTSAWADFDEDGWLDLALASDFETNELRFNNGDGTFRDGTQQAGVTDVENAMGSVIADFDEDGHLDWFVTSIWEPRADFDNHWGTTGNRLYMGDGAGTFVDESESRGVRDAMWAWGADAVDLENDGDLDLVVTNGRITGPRNAYLFEPFFDDPTRVFVNDGGTFHDRAIASNVLHDGQGRGVVPFDMERDGDMDLLIVGFGEPLTLYQNESDEVGHWLTVRIERPEGMNRFGVGSTVWVKRTPDDPPRRREIDANSTFGSQGPIEAHVGLGDHAGPIHEVRVVFPEGDQVVLSDVPADSELVVTGTE